MRKRTISPSDGPTIWVADSEYRCCLLCEGEDEGITVEHIVPGVLVQGRTFLCFRCAIAIGRASSSLLLDLYKEKTT